MKTPKEWFEEELSGEPLTQESVIEVLEMVQKEALEEILQDLNTIIELNEDDFDRGKGKYLLGTYIETFKCKYFEILNK